MLIHESTRKLVAIPMVTLLLATAIVVAENAIQSAAAQERINLERTMLWCGPHGYVRKQRVYGLGKQ